MNTTGDKIRKIQALMNNQSATAGEREACNRALKAIRAKVGEKEYKLALDSINFDAEQTQLYKDLEEKARRQQSRQFQQFRQAQYRHRTAGDQMAAGRAAEIFEDAWRKLQEKCRREAYPNSYGDRKR